MKIRSICLWTVCFCLLFSRVVSAASVNVHTGSKSGIKVQADIEVVADSNGRTNFRDQSDEEIQYLSEPGQPQIPWKVITVLLPPNADLSTVSYTVNSITLNPVEGTFNVEPSPLYATWDENGNSVLIMPEGRTIVDGRDVDIYTANEFWPRQDARISQKGELRQWKLAEVAVPLVRYNPVTGRLQELAAADIDVTFGRINRSATAKKFHGLSSKNWKKQSGRVKKLAANFDQAAGDYETLAAELNASGSPVSGSSAVGSDFPAAGINSKGYVIITTNNIVSNSSKLDDFVAYKQGLGWNMQVITESDWGGGTGTTAYDNIHSWLQNNYSTDDILYVLLIGTANTDTGTVPMLWYDDGREGGAPTDFFYSSFTGDAYWEVAVGRIPYYGIISDLDNLLQKAINYEKSTDTVWRNSALLPMARLDDTTAVYECGEQMKSNILDPLSITSDRIYEQDFGVGPEYTYPAAYMANVWASNPYGLVFWNTHGNITIASEFIGTWDVPNLNDNYPSIVYQGSCLNGYPEDSANLGYAILRNGGITTVASTRDTFYSAGQTSYPTDWCMGGLGYRYLDRICTSQESVGVAWSNARQDSNTYVPCRMRQTLYGDPSISLTFSPQLIAHYKFEGNANDSSDNGYNGTTSGSPAYTTGHAGQAIYLDGVNDFITLPSGVTSRDITLAAWIYWAGGNQWQRIFDFGNDTNQYMFLTPRSGSNTLRFSIKNGGSEQMVETTQLTTGQWVHVAVTLNGDTAKLYVDGALADTNTGVTINPSDFNPVNNYIGDSQFSIDPFFSGRIDDFRIYNYAMSDNEITRLSLSFTSDPINNTDGIELVPYSGQSLANYINVPAGGVTFSKVSGPEWLTVASNGTLSGTPKAVDAGENVFTVQVQDNLLAQSATAAMTIQAANVYNGTQGMEDLCGLVSQWLNTGCVDSPACNGADLDGDNNVTIADYSLLVHNWLVPEDLQLHLKFDEMTGTVANDGSIYRRNGSLVNSPAWSAGHDGGALSFDGSNYVEVANDDGLNPDTDSWSVAFWMKSETPSQGAMIVSKRQSTSPYPQYLIGLSNGTPTSFSAGSKLTFLIGADSGDRKGGYTMSDVDFSEWTHVCVVLDQNADTVYIYINGTPVQVYIPLNDTLPSINTTTPVYIGKNPALSAKPYYGLMDDVRVYDRPLSDIEIQNIYQ